MSADGVLRIAIACEDECHHAVVTYLARRVVLTEAALCHAEWLEDCLEHQWHFCGIAEHERYYKIKNAADDFKKAARDEGWPRRALHGHVDGKPRGPHIQVWRRLFLLFSEKEHPPDVLFVVMDTDGDLARRDALNTARSGPHRPSFPVIAATPDPEGEAWLIAGFEPADREESQRLDELRSDKSKKVSFAPHEEPHRLTARPNDAPTDAKRVLRFLLTGEHVSRPPSSEELPSWCERLLYDLDRLKRRGEACLLNDFLRELRDVLLPLLIPGHPSRV